MYSFLYKLLLLLNKYIWIYGYIHLLLSIVYILNTMIINGQFRISIVTIYK